MCYSTIRSRSQNLRGRTAHPETLLLLSKPVAQAQCRSSKSRTRDRSQRTGRRIRRDLAYLGRHACEEVVGIQGERTIAVDRFRMGRRCCSWISAGIDKPVRYQPDTRLAREGAQRHSGATRVERSDPAADRITGTQLRSAPGAAPLEPFNRPQSAVVIPEDGLEYTAVGGTVPTVLFSRALHEFTQAVDPIERQLEVRAE